MFSYCEKTLQYWLRKKSEKSEKIMGGALTSQNVADISTTSYVHI
jgi:hypothetical protein